MTRVATALGLIVFAVYLIFFSPQPIFLLGALLVGTLCYLEYANIVAAHKLPKPGILGMLLGAAILIKPGDALALASALLVLQFVLLLRKHDLHEITPAAACTFIGAFYTFAPWRFAIDLRAVSIHFLFFALALNWVGDSAAFYVGRLFGKHKLAPSISPGKSWEGAVASVVGSIVFGLIYLHYLFPQASYIAIVVIALVGNIAGQLGDLVESSIKRGAGLKDSGRLLPGHGGALDRLDSSLFALPTIYLLSRLFNLF